MESNAETSKGRNLFSPIDKPEAGFGIKLDSIFEEVEKNLPSIDFDVSDVSSDEEVAIFQRTIKTPTFDEDKDLDESLSLTSDSWEELLQGTNPAHLSTPDNDVMARIQHGHVVDSVSSEVPASGSQSHLATMEEQMYSSLALMENELFGGDSSDLVSTLSLRSIREVENEADVDTPQLSHTSQPAKTHSMGTNTMDSTSSVTDSRVKINNWVSGNTNSLTDNASRSGTFIDKTRDISQLEPSMRDGSPKERNNTPQAKPLDLVSRYLPSEAPSLTFQDLDNVDLDAVLSMQAGGRPVSLPLQRPPAAPRTAPRPAPGPTTATGSATTQADDDDNISLIEKLARLSVVQSGEAMREYDPDTGALSHPESASGDAPQHQPPYATKLRADNKEHSTKAMKTALNKTVEAQQKATGMSTQPPPLAVGEALMMQFTGPSAKPKVRRSPDTIYIDLRNFDVEKHQQQLSFEAVQRILRLPPQDQPDDSSSDEGDDSSSNLSLWHEQRRKMKEALREGKSIAHPESYNTEKSVSAKSVQPKDSKVIQSKTDVAEKATSNLPQTETAKTEVSSPVSPVAMSPEMTPSRVDTAKPPTPVVSQAERERQKRIDAARKAREARAAEHQSRVRLGQRLEALRPKSTISERNPAAEATPVVFDLEASYEPTLENLPTDLLQDREVLLLTVHMACNGEIILHRGSANRSVDSGHGLSASYTTLVTWILSLVPDDFSFLKSPPGGARPASPVPGVPFQVVALQQMVLDEQLALYIAVCPADCSAQPDASIKTKKTRKRDDFSSVLSKFLSTNTLHTVCPWLQDLVSIEVTSPLSEQNHPFVYRPPLPNITTKPLSTFIQVNSGLEAVRRVFNLPVGFFWHTVESDDAKADITDGCVDHDVQNTMSLVYKKIYRDPRAMMGILNRLLQEGLDLSGLRLLYPTTALMSVAAGNLSSAQPRPGTQSNSPAGTPNQMELLRNVGPIVALSIRGMLARTLWLDAVGPADPVLARRTDPNSLCALYGGSSREECLLFCPRNPERISTELARWFGGRVPSSGVVNVGTAHRKRNNSGSKRMKGSKSSGVDSTTMESEIPTHNPPAMLTATTQGHIILVVSPLLPTRCLGLVLATCQRRGYRLHGIRRQRLTAKRTSSLGLAGIQVQAFSRGKCSPVQPDGVPYSDTTVDPGAGDAPPVPVRPSTALLLSKENSVHSAASLIEAFMVQLCLMDLLGSIQAEISEPLTSALLFHTVPYAESAMNILGRDFSKVPEVDRVITPGYIAPKLHTNPEMEQVVIVTLTGLQNMKNFGLLLGRLLGVVPLSRAASGPPVSSAFELLAVKWLASLSTQHAKELTPYEVGDPQWRQSLHKLTSEPAVVIALRGINAFSRLESILLAPSTPQSSHRTAKPSLECLMSRTADATYRQIALFFWDREVFPDNTVRKLIAFLPPLRSQHVSATERLHAIEETEVCLEESIFDTLVSGPRPIITLLVAKPDVVRRNLGKLLKRLSHDGFALVGARLLVLNQDEADLVIPHEDKENEVLHGMHRAYLTSAPSLVLALQRENAVWRLQKMLGPTDPAIARKAAQHFLRGLYGSDAIANGLHGSATYKSAVAEVKVFFPEGLCCQQNVDLTEDEVTCPAEDTTIDIRPARSVTVSEPAEPSSLPLATTKSSGTMPVNWNLPTSTLTETNCLLFMPSLLKQQGRGRKAAYVEIADSLFSNAFDLVGARLVWFNEAQAEHYLCLIKAGSFQMVPLLRSGPCLMLAVQRDNAVIAFDSLLGSTYVKDSIYAKYGTQILRPKDNKQARKHLAFFFDSLSPMAQLKIVQKEGSSTNVQT